MSTQSTAQKPLVPIHTKYTLRHMRDRGYRASNLSFQIGAIVVNDKDEILLFKNRVSEISQLPRLDVDALDVSLRNPFQFIYDQTGLKVDRLALLKTKRQYHDPNAEHWHDLEQELVFEDTVTAAPFSTGMDITWFRFDDQPLFPDGRQTIVHWHSGIVRACDPVQSDRDQCVRFVPLPEAIAVVKEDDYVGENALKLFDVLWAATKRFQTDREERSVLAVTARSVPSRTTGFSSGCLTTTVIPSYPPSQMAIPGSKPRPIATENSARFCHNAFWSSADCVFEVGAVLIDRSTECVLLVYDEERAQYTLPRVRRRDDFDALLQAPLQGLQAKVRIRTWHVEQDPLNQSFHVHGQIGVLCISLPLPRMGKKTLVPPDGNWHNATAIEVYSRETTTNPFHVSIGTLWSKGDSDKWLDGYQLLSYWYAGEIVQWQLPVTVDDLSEGQQSASGYRLESFETALALLKGQDDLTCNALTQFVAIWRNAKIIASGGTKLV